MSRLRFICADIWGGKSVTRAYYNVRLRQDVLRGKVIDIGGGKDADYLSFMPQAPETLFTTLDVKAGAVIDFETDRLPSSDDAFDTVLFLNVMEHIYNHQHITNEVVRILKPGGQLLGVVPFLMWYHPDPDDFFRYTNSALQKILTNAGAREITIESLARGPFTAACQMILSTVPRLLRVPVFLFFDLLDSIFLFFRPTHGARYVLGYYFKVSK